MTRAIVATEMLSLNSNGIMEFKDVPSIADVSVFKVHIKQYKKSCDFGFYCQYVGIKDQDHCTYLFLLL